MSVEARMQILELHFINAMAILNEAVPEEKVEEFGIVMSSFMRSSSEAGSPILEMVEEMHEQLGKVAGE